MTTTNIYSAYDTFARIFNDSWGSGDSEAVLPDVEKLLLQYLPQKASILDICCGAGHLAQRLQDREYQITGLDGSSELLRYARENASESKFILDDARYFKLPASFNGVVCSNYGLNHITTLEELTNAFQNVYAALLANGLFMFDFRLDNHYKGEWKDAMAGDVKNEYAWALKRSYNLEERIGNIYITIFKLTNNNNWKRSDITWLVKGYYLEEVLNALQNVGFKDIDYYNQRDISANKKEADVVYFVCRK